MKEVWKDIERFNGEIQISNFGRVKRKMKKDSRIHRFKGEWYDFENREYIMTPMKHRKENVMFVRTRWKQKRVDIFIAREVLKAFTNLKQLLNRQAVLYIDGDFRNCYLNNLKLILKREEIQKRFKDGILRYAVYEFYGKYYTLKELSKFSSTKYRTLQDRLYKLKWNTYEAIEIPTSKHKGVNC